MGIKVINPPIAEPITLAEAKLHLRVDDTADDTLIAAQLSAARESAEQYLNIAIAEQTWEVALDGFPLHAAIELPGGAVSSIVSVTYANAVGTDTVISASGYALNNYGSPSWLIPAYGTNWAASYATPNAIRVRYIVGGGVLSPSIRAAILLTLGHLYAQREDSSAVPVSAIPMGARALLQPFRIGMGV